MEEGEGKTRGRRGVEREEEYGGGKMVGKIVEGRG